MSLSMATGRADITPTGFDAMGGYATQTAPRRATSTNQPLQARAMVIWRNSTAPKAVVSVEVQGFPRAWHQALRPRLVALGPWSSADIALVATHTHNGPMTPANPDPYIDYNASPVDIAAAESYWAWLADQIVDLLARLLAAPRTTVTLDYKSITQNFSQNRTTYVGYIETDVPVLVARRGDGTPVAILYSYGTHAVSGGLQTAWDGDYPGATSAILEASIPGCVALYLSGPAGDQVPTGTAGWSRRNELGWQLAGAVRSAAATAGRPLTAIASTALTEMVAPLSLPSTPAGWSDLRTAYVARAAYNGWPEAYAYARHANTMIAAIDAGTFPTGVPIPLQVWKLTGSPTLRIVFNGGEAISGAGVYYRGLYSGSNGIIFGSCANEVCCYVTGDGFWPPYAPSGSYEGGWDTDFPAAAGGSMLYYGYPGHMKFAEPQSIESVWAAALGPMLAGG